MNKPIPAPLEIAGEALRDKLVALAGKGDDLAAKARSAVVAHLKKVLADGRAAAEKQLTADGKGRACARRLSALQDAAIVALYGLAIHVHKAIPERMTVVAVGGYGRGLLAPGSDVDLLFLRAGRQTPEAEKAVEFILYCLWDLGLKVGHATRTVSDCISLSRSDMTIRTAILEARYIVGDRKLADDLAARFDNEVVKGTGREFIAAKLAERDQRHRQQGTSRYLVEPNVKEGKGGLRDLHTLFWIAQYLHPAEDIEAVMRLEVFQGREVRAFVRAFDFLEAVRAHLHFAAGRAEERLTFDIQPEIARRMGYGDRSRDGADSTPAVERFMRRYFLIAKEVGSLTRAFAAKLEADHMKSAPRGLSRYLPGRAPRRLPAESGFHVEGRRLTVDGPETFDSDPVNLLRLFHIADARDLDLHPDAFTAVTRRLGPWRSLVA